MKAPARLIYLAVLFFLVFPMVVGLAAPSLQTSTPEENARLTLARLKPEERVGQLFLVTFKGPEAGPSTQIYDLISNYHIGGVILSAANDNFISPDQTLPVALSLNRQLQIAKYNASNQEQVDKNTNETYRPTFIPLFIGISQEGDGYPYDQILSGVTPLPSQMAIGATWKPSLAQQVGSVLGSELSDLGFNLLLGPSLDVLEAPQAEGADDLGVRTFGGDPYWVGEMGKAFITGVHQGSNGAIAVVSKHFPGYGSSDRLPEEEVATVRKSLEQLKQIELAPFFTVTGNAPTSEATSDALLTSHIRYQGLQGNIRSTTRPVSLDPQAFSQLMGLDPFANWRTKGGVMVSDDLGGQAIRRFYQTSGSSFIARYVARDALQAGNDMLFISDFSSEEDSDSYHGLLRTLDFFTQKYREDTVFAQRVDDAVLRILTLKYRIYKNIFSLSQSLPSPDIPGSMGRSGQVSIDVAQQAATLIYPPQNDLNSQIPDPPGRNDHIVFITDNRYSTQCSKCPLEPVLPVNALEQVVIRLYSPQAGGQVLPGNLISYSFQDLQALLNTGSGILQIENDLKNANWIVFAMLNPDPSNPSSMALRNFLDQRPDLTLQKRVVVFAFNAPYYLDATNISKLSAYYALYSKTPRAIDVAARLLLQEIRPTGSLPVTVQGIGYDLNAETFPDPNQNIPLLLDIPEATPLIATGTPEAQPITQYKVGDTIPIRTGVILDHNEHPVPDNTIVRFMITHGEGGLPQTIEAQTSQGIAHATLRVDTAGILQIRAESEPAKQSALLTFNILTVTGQAVLPTETLNPTTTTTPSPVPTITATPTEVIITPLPIRRMNIGDWFLSLVFTFGASLLTYWIANLTGQVRWGLRAGLLVFIGGLLAYMYLALGMPGSESLVQSSGTLGILGITLIGAGLGWGAALGWRELRKA